MEAIQVQSGQIHGKVAVEAWWKFHERIILTSLNRCQICYVQCTLCDDATK